MSSYLKTASALLAVVILYYAASYAIFDYIKTVQNMP